MHFHRLGRVNRWLILYCLLQFRRGVFDFGIAILASSGSRREQAGPMNVFEIAVRELVPAFRIHRVAIVDPEMPFCVFRKSVQANKLILFVCGRPMHAPRAFAVRDAVSFSDELLGKGERIFVQPDGLMRLRESIGHTENDYEAGETDTRVF